MNYSAFSTYSCIRYYEFFKLAKLYVCPTNIFIGGATAPPGSTPLSRKLKYVPQLILCTTWPCMPSGITITFQFRTSKRYQNRFDVRNWNAIVTRWPARPSCTQNQMRNVLQWALDASRKGPRASCSCVLHVRYTFWYSILWYLFLYIVSSHTLKFTPLAKNVVLAQNLLTYAKEQPVCSV